MAAIRIEPAVVCSTAFSDMNSSAYNVGTISEGTLYLRDHIALKEVDQVANTVMELYAESAIAWKRYKMGFKLTFWEEKLVKFSFLFEERMRGLCNDFFSDKAEMNPTFRHVIELPSFIDID